MTDKNKRKYGYGIMIKNEALYEKIVLCRDFAREPKDSWSARKKVKKIFRENQCAGFDTKIYEKILLNYAIVNPGNAVITAQSLFQDKIETRKETTFTNPQSPILICAVKNDLKRIQKSLEHHRKIGVENFIFIDNNSDDGTYEWLMEQDVNVLWTDAKYCSAARCAWLMQVFEKWGYDRWYLILDSDELFVYPDCETRKVNDLISYMEKNHKTRMLTFMLDMYAKYNLSEIDELSDWSLEDYRYFDSDTYMLSKNLHYYKVTGGPRDRVLGAENKDGITMIQNKYPLVYLKRGEIYRYHYVYPFYHNFDTECIGALLHYKFLPGDLKKYQKIASDGNYANGSQFYKDSMKQIQENPELNFWYDGTVEYRTSKDLEKVNVIKKIKL